MSKEQRRALVVKHDRAWLAILARQASQAYQKGDMTALAELKKKIAETRERLGLPPL